jgi:hypothetical protein
MSTQTVSTAAPSMTTQTAPGSRYIVPSPVFKTNFNKHPFIMHHTLADHPLFTLPQLLKLALKTREKRPLELYYDAGHNVPIGARWSEMGEPPPIEEAFERIQDLGSWITIRQAQLDPEYADLFYGCMRELEAQTGQDFKKLMRVEDAIIFITSPNRTTTYHIDRETNFLLQISGSKTMYMFDGRDKEVLPDTEIERFWTVDNNAAVYRPEFQDRATTFRMVPGNGIHIPTNDPHWLQNDNNVSISLSVNFTMKDSERANIYRANHYLRRVGLKPDPPFRSPIKDAMKNAVMAATYMPVRSAKRTIRRLRGKQMRIA